MAVNIRPMQVKIKNLSTLTANSVQSYLNEAEIALRKISMNSTTFIVIARIVGSSRNRKYSPRVIPNPSTGSRFTGLDMGSIIEAVLARKAQAKTRGR